MLGGDAQEGRHGEVVPFALLERAHAQQVTVSLPRRVRPIVRRVDGVKYIFVDKPEYMDMAPIQEIVEKALAQSKRK